MIRIFAAAFLLTLLGHSGGVVQAVAERDMTAVGQNQDIDLKPAKIVILVDESGSISQPDMDRERDAASLIGQSELSTKSTVSVVGFASDNGTRSPVDVVCPPLVLSGPAERDHIAQCVSGLRKRTRPEGDGTDHAEALQQAMSYLRDGSPADGPKLIFLLTDGVLDVTDSPRYGANKTGDQRNDAAREVIRQTLTQARDAGVQVWPLGFGKVDTNALNGFAEGGYRGSCGPNVPQPRATVVSSSADVADALLRAFSSGRCAGVGPIQNTPVGSGASVEIPVTIPVIATDGSIIVAKHDGRIGVDYVDPQGKSVPKSGETGSGKFEVSGENSPVEVLHIVDPVPGQWKVRVSSGQGVPAQNVLTTVTWLGAAQALLLLDPPAPAVGQPVTVSLQVVLRGGKPVTQPDLLRGLAFSAELSGKDLPVQPIAMLDNGQDPDTAVDGTFTGRLTIPQEVTDEITFKGTVSGLGISAADALATVRVAPEVPPILATATLPTISTRVAPGETVRASVAVTNNTGQRHKVRVQVRGAGDAAITVPADDAVREVDPGRTTFEFRMVFAANTPEGVTTGVVQVVDGDDAGTVFHEKPFTVEVAYPPPPPPILQWVLGTVAGIAVVALALWLVARRRSQEVEGLMVQAVRNGQRAYLHTEARKAKQFRFTVTMHTLVPALDVAQPGDPTAFTLTRSRAGLTLLTPYGERHSMQLDQSVEVGEDLSITVSLDELRRNQEAQTDHYATQPVEEEPGPSGPQPTARDPYL
jgi:hypothetical protein